MLFFLLLINRQEMSWRYQNLLNTLQMKKSEIDRLSSEFEKSIRDKEVCVCTAHLLLVSFAKALIVTWLSVTYA